MHDLLAMSVQTRHPASLPTTLRHGTAMALLQSGVDLAVIALWLGHESIETTHMYVEADLAMKEKASATLAPPDAKAVKRFQGDDALLAS